jgi:hypothetical protein
MPRLDGVNRRLTVRETRAVAEQHDGDAVGQKHGSPGSSAASPRTVPDNLRNLRKPGSSFAGAMPEARKRGACTQLDFCHSRRTEIHNSFCNKDLAAPAQLDNAVL